MSPRLTAVLISEIANRVRDGARWTTAAASVGVAERTFAQWVAEGKTRMFVDADPSEPCPTCGAADDAPCVSRLGVATTRWHNTRPRSGADENDLYVQLVQSLSKAEAESKRSALDNWVNAWSTDWRAARDFLKQRWPDEFGDRAKNEFLPDLQGLEDAEQQRQADDSLARLLRL